MSNPAVPVVRTTALDEARYRRALEEIFGRLNYEKTPEAASSLGDFRTQQMQQLLAELGNPQDRLSIVHIAGSKGKGSTATMVARIAEAAGYRVGLFTSPHVDRFEERFTINSECATPGQVADLYDQVSRASHAVQTREQSPPHTFFELATAMGWMHFASEKVDLAVIEVGLGGRLDSTNVCQPLVTAVTSISRDHTRLLGNTLALIAGEKAGIIKQGVPVVTHVVDAAAAEVTAEVARKQGAPQFRLGYEFHHTPVVPEQENGLEPQNYRFHFDGFGESLRDLQLGMPGEHQTRNGALATAIAFLLRERGFCLPESAIRQGLLRACCSLRIEVLNHDPLVIVDAAHNPASIAALCETLRGIAAKRKVAIFSSSKDKEADELLRLLDGTMDEVWVTRFVNNPRAVDLDDLTQLAERNLTKPWRVSLDCSQAVSLMRSQAKEGDLFVFTGSFFLAAEAKALLTSPG